jgi:hypothetical protein
MCLRIVLCIIVTLTPGKKARCYTQCREDISWYNVNKEAVGIWKHIYPMKS